MGEEGRGADRLMERPAHWRAHSLGRELGRKVHHLGPGLLGSGLWIMGRGPELFSSGVK